MGDAKRRGSPELRMEKAIAGLRERLPASLECNECHAQLTDIKPMNTRGMEGLTAVGMANCVVCKSDTWVVDGTPEARAQFMAMMDHTNGGPGGKFGTAPRPG